MAIKCIERTWSTEINEYLKSYIMDADSDKAKLPKSAPGSVAVVAGKDGKVYMVNASGEWGDL